MTTDEAKQQLDDRVQEIISWHFSDETGSPFWLDWMKEAGWDPKEEIKSFEDIIKFPHFEDDLLRDLPNEQFVPKGMGDRPYNVFETGVTNFSPRVEIGLWWDPPVPGV